MKPSISIILAIAALASTPASGAAEFQVDVEGVKSAAGKVTLSLYSNAQTYLKTPAYVASAAATQGTTRVVFKDIAPGDYALSGYHDENANDKIDADGMGIPKEPYGFGNAAPSTMGPPSFEKARVTIPASAGTAVLHFK